MLPTELCITNSSAKEDLPKLGHGKLSFTFGYIASIVLVSRKLSLSIKMFGHNLGLSGVWFGALLLQFH